MFSQGASFLQSEIEQILSSHDVLVDFEDAYQADLTIRSANMPVLEIMKDGKFINLVLRREYNLVFESQPNLVLEVSQEGQWKVCEMTNSHFENQDETVNSFEFWDCTIRYENFSDSFIEGAA